MAKNPIPPSSSILFLLFIISRLVSILGKAKPWNPNFLSLDVSNRLHFDSQSLKQASNDFGKLIHTTPSAVLHPSSINDIVSLVKFSYENESFPFGISARGRGHSIRGQAMAINNGVVVEMTSLNNNGNGKRGGIRVSWSPLLGLYGDVGGEQLWIDVLEGALEEYGVAPVSWTDYLYLTVGGTLSNAGISGQTFRYGPQINNVYELDVITGKGELVTCSKNVNSELFYGVLGGLGQFGIITRARIPLAPAPKMVKWVRMLYDDFSVFAKDQEHLISINGGLDYVEGSLILRQSPPNNWRSSFFSTSDHTRIISLVTKHGIIYSLEVVKYYDDHTIDIVDKVNVDVASELQQLLKGLSFLPELIFTKDVPYKDFLNRVRSGELKLQSKGLWDVPHPWLNLFVPKSRISDFNSGVFEDIILKQEANITGPILVYPMYQKKWDNRMSAVIPNEDIFYCVGFLHSSGENDWEVLEAQNNQILDFCDKAEIKVKQYLPHYQNKEDWMNHFGSKWKTFQERKSQFDPKAILSQGQRIFNSIQGGGDFIA